VKVEQSFHKVEEVPGIRLNRSIIAADFRLLGQHIELWNCHFPPVRSGTLANPYDEANAMGQLVRETSGKSRTLVRLKCFDACPRTELT